jgi:hypothetical protein
MIKAANIFYTRFRGHEGIRLSFLNIALRQARSSHLPSTYVPVSAVVAPQRCQTRGFGCNLMSDSYPPGGKRAQSGVRQKLDINGLPVPSSSLRKRLRHEQ